MIAPQAKLDGRALYYVEIFDGNVIFKNPVFVKVNKAFECDEHLVVTEGDPRIFPRIVRVRVIFVKIRVLYQKSTSCRQQFPVEISAAFMYKVQNMNSDKSFFQAVYPDSFVLLQIRQALRAAFLFSSVDYL